MTVASMMASAEAHKLYIDGAWRDARSGERIPVLAPATGERIAEVGAAGPADVDAAVEVAHAAFEDGRWSRLTPGQRSDILMRFADLMAAEAEDLAQMESRNTGKPITMARDFDVAFSIDNARHFAGACRVMSTLGRRNTCPATNPRSAASQWAWSPALRPGTIHSTWRSGRSCRRWRQGTRSSSSRRR